MALMKVRYRGLSDYRILTAAQMDYDHGIQFGEHQGVPRGVADKINRDLTGMDVNPQKDLVWGPHNGHTLVLDVDENMERVLREQGHFSLSAVNDDGSERAIAVASTNDDNPSEVIANIDGTGEQRNEVDPKNVPEASAPGNDDATADADNTPTRRVKGNATKGKS